MKLAIPLLSLTMITFNAYADNLFCAKTSGYIKTGMSLSQVSNICGKPVTVKKDKASNVKRVPIEQWIYHNVSKLAIEQWVNQSGNFAGTTGNFNHQVGGANDSNLTVIFRDNVVIGIVLNGMAMPAADVCNGNNISNGDTMSNVSFACGQPAYTNKTYQTIQTGEMSQVEVWQINPAPYQPPVTLTFRNGILESIAK